jgi:transcriptional regulator with XRE-family HTH domain
VAVTSTFPALPGLWLDRKLTQEEFAELVGISVDFLSLIERGINSPGFEALERMADRFDLQVRELFDFRKTTRGASR